MLVGAFLRSGWPHRPQQMFQKVGREAPHLLEKCSGAAGTAGAGQTSKMHPHKSGQIGPGPWTIKRVHAQERLRNTSCTQQNVTHRYKHKTTQHMPLFSESPPPDELGQSKKRPLRMLRGNTTAAERQHRNTRVLMLS